MTRDGRSAGLGLLAAGIWILLVASIAAWPFAAAGIGPVSTAIALLPLLLPLPGLINRRHRTLQWAPLTLAPALAVALTEVLVNIPARVPATLSLALSFAAFAGVIAALRARSRAR